MWHPGISRRGINVTASQQVCEIFTADDGSWRIHEDSGAVLYGLVAERTPARKDCCSHGWQSFTPLPGIKRYESNCNIISRHLYSVILKEKGKLRLETNPRKNDFVYSVYARTSPKDVTQKKHTYMVTSDPFLIIFLITWIFFTFYYGQMTLSK